MKEPVIRPFEEKDEAVLERLLYEAVYKEPGSKPVPFDIIYTPEIYRYIEHFPHRDGDRGLVAEIDGAVMGAVWVRVLDGQAGRAKGFGNIGPGVPEFAISLLPEYRGRGVGTKLMRAMLEELRRAGIKKATLSVQKNNYAVGMYRKVGFETVRENDEDYLMECVL